MLFKSISIIILLIHSPLLSQTYISGSVAGDWSMDNHPYILTGDATIVVGEILNIDTNVVVNLGAMYEIRIEGELNANGASFISGGSIFSNGGHVVFSDCSFNNLDEGLSFFGGSVLMEYCLIDSTHETGITLSGTDSASIRYNQILNSGDYGIKISQTNAVEIVSNVLRGNSTHDTNHPALFIDSCSPQVVEENVIEENHAQGIGIWTLTETAAPTIRNNIVRRNFTGITIVNSNAFIEGNIIVANYQRGNAESGAGIFAGYPSSNGIVMNNYIGGNYYGVSNISNAALNLGDMINDYPGDDGLNIFYENGFDGQAWHIWNDTSNELLAQNNYWMGLDLEDVDAAIWDNEEGGGTVIFEPIYVENLPSPPDINNDALVNILDVVLAIESIMDQAFPDPITFFLSDINTDYYINIQDIVVLIEQVIGT